MGNIATSDDNINQHPDDSNNASSSFSNLMPSLKNKPKEQSKIYKQLLKDIKKLRIRDENNQYNPHRHQQSILNHLPLHLKQFSNSIHAVNEFWLQHIKRLTQQQLQETAMLLYCHLYCKVTPNVRRLLLKANKGNVPSHTLMIFTIFEYVIRIMSDTNGISHKKLFEQLKTIGALHQPFNLICDHDFEMHNEHKNSDIYEMILDSFNYSMEQIFNRSYTVHIRFCFSQLYRVIVNIMNKNDLQTLVLTDNRSREAAAHGDDIKIDSTLRDVDKFLGSFEECLSHDVGSLYFKKFLEEQFCVENYLFHEAVQKYKFVKCNQRIKVGTDIINTFIKKHCEKEVNISAMTRNKILTIIHLTKKMNDNKEKYQNILTLSHNKSRTHHQVIEIATAGLGNHSDSSQKHNIKLGDMVYSDGFTDDLFDAAYNEIIYLMKSNMWTMFRNTILGYCNNDHFVKQQQSKYKEQKNEDNKKRMMVKNMNTLAKIKKNKKNNMFNKKNIRVVIATPLTPLTPTSATFSGSTPIDADSEIEDDSGYWDAMRGSVIYRHHGDALVVPSPVRSSAIMKPRPFETPPFLLNSQTSLKLMDQDSGDSLCDLSRKHIPEFTSSIGFTEKGMKT